MQELQELPCTEMDDWMVYNATVEPISAAARLELQLAQVCAVVASCAPRKRRGQRFTVKQFLPKWSRPKRSAKEMWMKATTLVRAGGLVRKSNGTD